MEPLLRRDMLRVEKLAGMVPVPVAAIMAGSACCRSHSIVSPSDLWPSSRVNWKTLAAQAAGIRIRRPRPSTLVWRSFVDLLDGCCCCSCCWAAACCCWEGFLEGSVKVSDLVAIAKEASTAAEEGEALVEGVEGETDDGVRLPPAAAVPAVLVAPVILLVRPAAGGMEMEAINGAERPCCWWWWWWWRWKGEKW